MLAATIPEPFDSPDHIFEVKWGGVRAIAEVADGRVRLHGRNLRDLTPLYPELAVLGRAIRAERAVVDGEIVAWGAEQLPSFELLRPRLLQPDTPVPARRQSPVVYHIFDLLELEGRWLPQRPLFERRNLLHERLVPVRSVQAADFVREEGIAFFQAVGGYHLEGIIAKDVRSTYQPGQRSDAWQEVRVMQADDFVVGGYTFGGGLRNDPIASLLLGAYRHRRLEFVGEVSIGCTEREARQLAALLAPLHAGHPPFARPPEIETRFLYWCRPELACHVRYAQWTKERRLRFPVFVAPRPDVPPEECLVPEG
jgi:DNA ligase D-like protein (predicted ligase)